MCWSACGLNRGPNAHERPKHGGRTSAGFQAAAGVRRFRLGGCNHADRSPVLKINNSAIVGRILRRPAFATLVKLWISKLIDVKNSSLFDIHERRPEGWLKPGSRELRKLERTVRGLPAFLSRTRQ